MSLLAQLFADVSFLEVALAVVAVGCAERAMMHLPDSVVGENGWLLRLNAAEN